MATRLSDDDDVLVVSWACANTSPATHTAAKATTSGFVAGVFMSSFGFFVLRGIGKWLNIHKGNSVTFWCLWGDTVQFP